MYLNNLPMPPSLNSCYMPLPNGGRCRSQSYKDFQKAFNQWAIDNYLDINACRASLKGIFQIGLVLTFSLPRGILITKKGTVKRWDSSNRIKVIEDALSEALNLDDCLIWDVRAIKRIGDKDYPQITANFCILDSLYYGII